MTGQPLPRDAGLSLLLGGHEPAWLRVTAGRAEPIRGLPRSGNGYQFIRIAGGWAAQPFPVDAGCVISQGTRAGLLLAQELASPGPVRYELWDPATGRVRLSFLNLIAAGPAEIAWMPGCTTGCRVHVLDPSSRRAGEISLPGRSTAYAGAFSPDGRLLALQVTARAMASGQAAATRLVVATVASGRITAVPGSTVGSGIGVDFGWQAGSHRLIADVPAGTPGRPEWQIAVWQPGDARLSTALARVPENSWPVIDQGPY